MDTCSSSPVIADPPDGGIGSATRSGSPSNLSSQNITRPDLFIGMTVLVVGSTSVLILKNNPALELLDTSILVSPSLYEVALPYASKMVNCRGILLPSKVSFIELQKEMYWLYQEYHQLLNDHKYKNSSSIKWRSQPRETN